MKQVLTFGKFMESNKKIRQTFAAVAVLVMLVLCTAGNDSKSLTESRLMRVPAIHGDTIVFGYAGDLWVAKAGLETAARQLTSHLGFDNRPRISPDGRLVAFTGSYDGASEIYLVPIEGGEPRRLTYNPNSENILGWTPVAR